MKTYNYSPFSSWKWKTYDGKSNYNIEDFVEKYKGNDFYIGTDSQNYSKQNLCVFTTVVVGYEWGRGGDIIIGREKLSFIDALRQRLLIEAMRSLETAMYVDSKISNKNTIHIHLDVNKNLKYKSGKYKDELVGLIVSQGFICKVKPDAFAASKAADKKC